jgi:hypothetical protein
MNVGQFIGYYGIDGKVMGIKDSVTLESFFLGLISYLGGSVAFPDFYSSYFS